MVQPTLYRYFPSPRPLKRPPSKTFLHLPFILRREIYLLAGLSTNSTIYLNYIPSSNEHCTQDYNPLVPEHWPVEPYITPRSHSLSHFLDSYLPQPQILLNRHCECQDCNSHASYNSNGAWIYTACNCAPLPWQLLYVSKAIADEVFSIFYSENHFSVFRNSLCGLSALSSLPKSALLDMASLSICLNYFEPEVSRKTRSFGPVIQSCDIDCHAPCAASKQQRLFTKAKLHHEEASIKELQKLCQVLTHIQSQQLNLSFTCDVSDTSIAEEVLHPLFQLPCLRECSIRLGYLYLPDDKTDYTPIQHVAQEAVKKLTTPPPAARKPFNFPALPLEIQLQILSHTSLVTPYDLVWGPNTPIAKDIKTPFYEPRTFPWRAYPSNAECCTACSPFPPLEPEICFCWSSFAAFSSTCTCFRFPLPLFLLNKSTKNIAEEIFYSRNHFQVLRRVYNPSRELEIYSFLAWIPESARRRLRFLTWEMSWGCMSDWGRYLQKGDKTHTQWLATLNFLNEIPAGQLSLTIDTSFSQDYIYIQNGGWEYGDSGIVLPDSVYLAEAEFTFGIAASLARDLVESEIRLRDSFWWFEGLRLRGEGGELREERDLDRGRLLEKMVMGPAYEGELRGKGVRRAEWNGYQRYQPHC